MRLRFTRGNPAHAADLKRMKIIRAVSISCPVVRL
jgi:hypothetical protein